MAEVYLSGLPQLFHTHLSVKCLPQMLSPVPICLEPKKKFIFRYHICDSKATYEDDSLVPDEFQRFIHGTPTRVAKDDTYWSPID